jgi:DNA-binding NarL/FixJ family response regulator
VNHHTYTRAGRAPMFNLAGSDAHSRDQESPGDCSGQADEPGLGRSIVVNQVDRRTEIIRIGLIDTNSLSRDCFVRAFRASQQDITVTSFQSVQDCVSFSTDSLDVVVYFSHTDGLFDLGPGRDITFLRDTFGQLPIIVLSDAMTAADASTIRNVLKAGIRGFIPTRSIEMPAVAAAIRFVRAGGTFAPVDLVLAGGYDRTVTRNDPPPAEQLTQRQFAVLSHLRQGKANKIIAYELGMSESTVKVHIRNIMRKMGATNRTQAVYKSQQMALGAISAGLSAGKAS